MGVANDTMAIVTYTTPIYTGDICVIVHIMYTKSLVGQCRPHKMVDE